MFLFAIITMKLEKVRRLSPFVARETAKIAPPECLALSENGFTFRMAYGIWQLFASLDSFVNETRLQNFVRCTRPNRSHRCRFSSSTNFAYDRVLLPFSVTKCAPEWIVSGELMAFSTKSRFTNCPMHRIGAKQGAKTDNRTVSRLRAKITAITVIADPFIGQLEAIPSFVYDESKMSHSHHFASLDAKRMANNRLCNKYVYFMHR